MKRIPIPYFKISLGLGLGWLAVLLIWLPLTMKPFEAHQITFIKAAGPLPNGVAAGDTTSTSTVLWTRGTVVGPVSFAYSTDPTFNTQVQITTTAVTTLLQPVKVEITGLNPATTYYYRATDADGSSASGRFRTAAPTGVRTIVSQFIVNPGRTYLPLISK